MRRRSETWRPPSQPCSRIANAAEMSATVAARQLSRMRLGPPKPGPKVPRRPAEKRRYVPVPVRAQKMEQVPTKQRAKAGGRGGGLADEQKARAIARLYAIQLAALTGRRGRGARGRGARARGPRCQQKPAKDRGPPTEEEEEEEEEEEDETEGEGPMPLGDDQNTGPDDGHDKGPDRGPGHAAVLYAH